MAEPAPSLRLVPKGSWAPRTKFVRPEVSANVVIDDALLVGVRRSMVDVAITLISAQAGAGKTTLAAAAVGPGSSMTAGWITLDSGDDDLANLLALLSEAISMLVPDGCPAFVEFLDGVVDTAIDPRRAVGVLINDLVAADPPPFVLVIDDLHVLHDEAALAALDYLLAHLPPPFHVLLTSRVDPPLSLSRLRTTGRLAEVRGDDLKLDTGQADTLLNDHLGLGLADEEVAAIVDAVGGWATGVRLLGRSLHRGDVLNAPRRSDRDPAALYDYLTDEVLGDETDDRRRFLFDTCVLFELTPRACAALAARDDAGAILADLHRRLHFLVLAVDADAHVYKYHDLFAEFLRRRLAANDPGRLAEQHGRAASVVSEAPRKIEHLLAAGETERAADAIESVGRDILHQPTAVHRVSAWIDRLPPSVVADRPWLRLLAGVTATNRGDMTAAIEWLQPLLEPLRATDDFLGEWLALRNLHQATNDHGGLMPRISALAARPEFAQLRPAIQVDHHIGAAYGALYTTRWDDAASHVAKAFELATTTFDPVSAEILALHVSPFFGIIDGGLDLIEAYVDHVEDRAPLGPSFVRLGLLHQRALAALFRGRFAEAADAATAGRGLLDRLGGGLIYLRSTFDWVMTTTWFASGELHRAEQLLAQRVRDQPTADLDRAMNRLQAPMHARVLRAQGRSDQIAAIAFDMRSGLRLAPTPELGELMTLATTAQLAWANRDHDAAVADLEASVELEDKLRFVPGVGSPRVDLAVLLHEMGHRDDSRRHLTIALRTCETRGTPGLIAQAGSVVIPLLEEANKGGIAAATVSSALTTLGTRASPSPIVVPGSPEVLSPREVEVLRLLVGGASNRGIADALVVSEHTAKTHVRHIMSKLAVRSRAEAAARAHREHLV